jgi:SAM-dependent methyltransferase
MKQYIKRVLNRFQPRARYLSSLPPSSKVLDVGCGTGGNGLALRSLHADIEIHGIDLLPEDRVPDFYSYAIVDLDKGTLPYPDEYFDAIVFTHVLEHLRSPLELGKELHRVMKKHGTMYVETPNWTSVLVPSFGFHREQHNPFNFYDDPTHVKPGSKHGLFEFLLQSCELRVDKVGTVRNWMRVPCDPAIILVGLLTRRRVYIVSSIWNLSGWCIYGVGVKE